MYWIYGVAIWLLLCNKLQILAVNVASIKAFCCWTIRTMVLAPSNFGGSRAPYHTSVAALPPRTHPIGRRKCSWRLQGREALKILQPLLGLLSACCFLCLWEILLRGSLNLVCFWSQFLEGNDHSFYLWSCLHLKRTKKNSFWSLWLGKKWAIKALKGFLHSHERISLG